MTRKIIEAVRHWWLLDLRVIRPLLPTMTGRAKTIDNNDGTEGKAFKIEWFPDEAVIDCSETMRLAIKRGVDAVEPWPTFEERQTIPCPQLADFIAKYGDYHSAAPEYWAVLEEWRAAMRVGGIDL